MVAVDKSKDTPVEAARELLRKDEVTLSNGDKVEIRLCRPRDLPMFFDLIGKLYNDLGITPEQTSGEGKLEQFIRERIDDHAFILQLIAIRAKEVFELAAQVTNMSTDKFDDLDLDDAVRVIKRIGEMNYDFFMVAVIPQFGKELRVAAKRRVKTLLTK